MLTLNIQNKEVNNKNDLHVKPFKNEHLTSGWRLKIPYIRSMAWKTGWTKTQKPGKGIVRISWKEM